VWKGECGSTPCLPITTTTTTNMASTAKDKFDAAVNVIKSLPKNGAFYFERKVFNL
jgi:hypothetical protein